MPNASELTRICPDEQDMKTVKIYKEEFDTNVSEIEKAEKIWQAVFPSEYKAFLLRNNGGIPYPNCPAVSAENDSQLWPIERFLSIGDITLQKLHPMLYALDDVDEEDFEIRQISRDQILVFAIGERGVYFINLHSDDYSQIYFANYSGGDGIVKVNTKSFLNFIESLELPEWTGEQYDPNYEIRLPGYWGNKILQTGLFYTPHVPALGLTRFMEVFEVSGDIQPPEDGYPTISQKYVHDRLKLEYLFEKGCSTEGLLLYARDAKTIKFLLDHKGLDINKPNKGRYPLQNYLTPGHDIKGLYELMDQLLEMNIKMDWSIQGIKVDGKPDLPMIKKLQALHELYLKSEIDDKNWWIKNGKPGGHTPFKRSRLIEEKLGILPDSGSLVG